MAYVYDTYTTPGQGKVLSRLVDGLKCDNYWLLTFTSVSELPVSSTSLRSFDDKLPAMTTEELKALATSLGIGTSLEITSAWELAEIIIEELSQEAE